MRTLGLILYFLFACHGLSDDTEQSNDFCGDNPEQELQQAYLEYGESFLSQLSKRLSKRSNKHDQLKAFEAYFKTESNPRFWLSPNSITELDADNGPKVNPAILEHTFYNSLFFPPDQDDDVSMA